MFFTLGPKSRERLKGVHPALVKRVERAIQLTTQDFSVLEGVRTAARQKELYAQGRTKPGPKVTWTLNSRHKVQSDGYGHAVDLVPFPLDWNTAERFSDIAAAMLAADGEIDDDYKVVWGRNWDGDDKPGEKGETDSPHFQLDMR